MSDIQRVMIGGATVIYDRDRTQENLASGWSAIQLPFQGTDSRITEAVVREAGEDIGIAAHKSARRIELSSQDIVLMEHADKAVEDFRVSVNNVLSRRAQARRDAFDDATRKVTPARAPKKRVRDYVNQPSRR